MKTSAQFKLIKAEDLEIVAMVYSTPSANYAMHGEGSPFEIEQSIFNETLFNSANFPEDTARCSCCGSTNLKYACHVVQLSTNEGFYLGRDCAYKVENLANGLNLKGADLKERAAAKNRVSIWKRDNAEHADIIEWAESKDAHYIASDIASKIARYGSISQKQIDLIYKLKAQDDERAAKKAAEPTATSPAPEGRVEVQGEVLCLKQQESNFGYHSTWTTKMLVRLSDTAAKVWSTAPSAIVDSIEKGSIVKFTATFERSADDQFFSFAKRPSKASIISAS
tara:strand:+ start:117 stop:959 length:843 start_codon:yes stop_codon:yes gene_type:complete